MYEVNKFLNKYLSDNDIVICAVSGGVDSMSLLHMLQKYNIKIICAHVNHNLREESLEEYSFVKNYCDKNNIIFEGITLDKIDENNIESKFREKRYSFFESLVNKYHAKFLLTAHHGDDLMETILMKIVRGSSIDGYSGFNKVSIREGYKILRPLIYLSKEEIYKYAFDNNIEYREDKTNNSDKYTRNRYRKYILPKLKEENINVHKKFLKYSEELNDSYIFINNYVNDIFNKYYDKDILDISYIKTLDDFIIKKIIFILLEKHYNKNINLINDNNIIEILNIVKSNKPNLSIDLPNDYIINKSYDKLCIIGNKAINNYKYELKDQVKVFNGLIKKVSDTNLTNNFVCHLNSKDIKLPLYIRNRKDGDYIEVLGLNGKKKIKDIFIDEKIDKKLRDIYPIVVDSNDNIVWLPGIKKSKYDVLKLKNYDIILWYEREVSNE